MRARRDLALLLFFPITFAATWTAWFVAASIGVGSSLSVVKSVIVLVGVFAPAIVALALSALEEGRAGTSALLAQLGRWEVRPQWYLFAVTYLAIVKVAVAVAIRVVTGAWPRFGDTPFVVMVLAVIASTLPQAGEELGWRGFALPRLAPILGLPGASILLGMLWAAWHLPLFFVMQGDTVGQSFPLYAMQVTALSVAMTWLYWRTSASLPLVMLLHSAVNNTKDLVPSAAPGASSVFTLRASTTGWGTVVVLWLCAFWFLYDMRNVRDVRLPSTPGGQ